MIARTDRLQIEPLTPEHAPILFAALDDERVGRHIGGPDVTTVEALTDRIGHLQRGAPAGSGQTWLNWAVRLDSEGHPVIGRREATVHDGLAEMAYVFGPDWWGRGYATEGVRWMIGNLASRPDVDSLWATVDPANVASARLLGRLGFSPTEPPDRLPHSYDPGDLVFHRPAVGRS